MLMINSKPKIIDTDENNKIQVLKVKGKTKFIDFKIEDDIMKLQRQIYCVVVKETDDNKDI